MTNIRLIEWVRDNTPSEKMLYRESFLKIYYFISNDILSLFENKFIREWDKRINYVNSYHDIIGTHWSKSIKHPVLKITYKGTEIVFRYNFYDYEIAVISDIELNIPMNDLFESKNESFYYQGFPEEYKLTERYEDNKKKFMAYIRDKYKFYTFMYILKQEIDNNRLNYNYAVKSEEKTDIMDFDLNTLYPKNFMIEMELKPNDKIYKEEI